MPPNFERLRLKWKGRETQIKALISTLYFQYGPPVMVYGHRGTGKTGVVLDVLREVAGERFVYVDCKTCYSYVSDMKLVSCITTSSLPCMYV